MITRWVHCHCNSNMHLWLMSNFYRDSFKLRNYRNSNKQYHCQCTFNQWIVNFNSIQTATITSSNLQSIPLKFWWVTILYQICQTCYSPSQCMSINLNWTKLLCNQTFITTHWISNRSCQLINSFQTLINKLLLIKAATIKTKIK